MVGQLTSHKAFNTRRLKGTLGATKQIFFSVISSNGEATGQT